MIADCLLCQRPLIETTVPYLLLHEETDECLVRITDKWGVSVDDHFELIGDDIYHRGEAETEEGLPPAADDDGAIDIVQFYPIEKALPRMFEDLGLERLGGRSTGSGWSSVSAYQKCPYYWMRRYLKPITVENFGIAVEDDRLAIGSLTHTLLAVYYQRMIVGDYPLTPELVNQRVREWGCNPKIFEESWRLYTGYRLFYKHENIQPLAVEYNIRDPRTNDSCRYDLIAFFPDEKPGFLPGTYALEHKTAARFDANTLEGWHGDGEVLGQVNSWDRLGLHRRFGPLRGVIVNILGKQKVAEFHRTLVAPTTFTVDQHRNDLCVWNAKINHSKATGDFPRARNNCIRGFMRCDLWNHCNSGE